MALLSVPNRPWLQNLLTAGMLVTVSALLYALLNRVLHDPVSPEAAARGRQNYLEALRKHLASGGSPYVPLRLSLFAAPSASPSPITVLEAFNDSNRHLLLSGSPGSGKTTTLVALARQLADDALANPEAPIPFVLNLARFDVASLRTRRFGAILGKELQRDFRRYPLRRWIYSELPDFRRKRDDLIDHWIEEETSLTWLLDGLDEVPPDKAQPLLDFLFEEIGDQPVVVTWRNDRDLIPFSRLTTVTLLPLSDAEIASYLSLAASPHTLEILQSDVHLQNFSRNPLFLSVIAEVVRSGKFQFRVGSGIEGLFDGYFTLLIERSNVLPGRSNVRFTRDRVLSALDWLAATLAERQAGLVGLGGLAGLLARTPVFPATGFCFPLQLASALVGLAVALGLASLFELRFSVYGGIPAALRAGAITALVDLAVFLPFLVLTKSGFERLTTSARATSCGNDEYQLGSTHSSPGAATRVFSARVRHRRI
jgi:NACHT domain